MRIVRLRSGPYWAIGCLVVAIGIFSLQDLIIKLISGSYPVHQAMALRSVVAMPLIVLIAVLDGSLLRLLSPRWPMLLGRGFINLLSYTTYYLGLAALPFATCVTLFFTAPIFITLLSAITLKESVGPKRLAAVVLGFVGVLVIVRPGSNFFEWAALLPICAGVTYGTAQVIARRIGQAESSSIMASYSNFAFILGSFGMAVLFGQGGYPDEAHASLAFLLRGWSTPSLKDLFLMMSCGVIAAVALTLLSEAYRSAPASTVAPFEYSALGWSVFYGWMVWGEHPDFMGWLGIIIIIGAGIYVLYRQPTG